jgi:sugar phosphate isomerase/epimerase
VKLGLCSIAALDLPLAEVAAAAARAGADGLEVTGRAPHLAEDADLPAVRATREVVTSAGLEVLAYGSYLGHAEPHTRAHAQREVERATALAAPLLRVWAGLRPGEADEGFAGVVELLGQACDAAHERDIEVVVERHIGSFADTPERALRLLAEVGRPNFSLNYQVCDFLEPDAAAAQTDDARELAPHARYAHLKNYVSSDAAGGRLVHGGSLAGGVLDYSGILTALVEAGYSGPMSVEFLSAEPAPLEDRLARDLSFVRETLSGLGVR